ncbi:PucR family transcriptional regulator [Streptomyces ortus]|uniref:Helix-turn-helix domain-containing protein n=1 Tax=Streptomyces ortus TaxID=2867268 RepID=A0ABT3VEA5_9ACTN|nr:PucR family transcriptional regulator [Streptomyces ortus]MCX4238252.1 helix-turn-helix domain-containing protein [Streptomyces ortus]
MQQALRSRAELVHGPPSAALSRAPKVRSLIDADAVRVLHRSARVLLNNLPELTDRLVAALREREPAYRSTLESDPAGTWQEAHRSLRHSVGALLDPRSARDAALHCSWKIGASRAEQGLPLDALLHAFRLGGSLIWQSLVEETSRTAPEDVRLLVHVAADVWNFVDEHCTLVADVYRKVERQHAWRQEHRVRLLTAALLDGTSRIADVAETAEALELPEQGRYAVIAVAGGRQAGRTSVPGAVVPAGARVYWHTGMEVDHCIVLVGDGESGGDGDGVRTEPTVGLSAPAGTRVGVGPVVAGLAAVGDARRLADMALSMCADDGGTVRLSEQLPAALVMSCPELGGALAERVLGPLLRLEPSDRDILLDTLAAWLDCDGSAQRASARLYCHRNTVLNRLKRCEQLTGRSLARPADMVEFSLALTARRLLRDT